MTASAGVFESVGIVSTSTPLVKSRRTRCGLPTGIRLFQRVRWKIDVNRTGMDGAPVLGDDGAVEASQSSPRRYPPVLRERAIPCRTGRPRLIGPGAPPRPRVRRTTRAVRDGRVHSCSTATRTPNSATGEHAAQAVAVMHGDVAAALADIACRGEVTQRSIHAFARGCHEARPGCLREAEGNAQASAVDRLAILIGELDQLQGNARTNAVEGETRHL